MLQKCVGSSLIFFRIFCTAHRCLAASNYISCRFMLVWLGPVLLLKSPLFRRTDPRLSAICLMLLCLHNVGWGHTGVGHVRLFGTIVFWHYYFLCLWQVHFHLHEIKPVVSTYLLTDRPTDRPSHPPSLSIYPPTHPLLLLLSSAAAADRGTTMYLLF